jgi:hypothetical protein
MQGLYQRGSTKKLWKDGQASSKNLLGQSDGWFGVIELSEILGGDGTVRARFVERCYAL